MTNAEITLRGQANQANIAEQDRRSKEQIAAHDRKSREKVSKYSDDTRAATADKDRAQKERSDSRSDSTARRGQNFKYYADIYGSTTKLIPAMGLAANDPAWYTQGFSQSEIKALVPTNWKIDAYETTQYDAKQCHDIIYSFKNTIPNPNFEPGEIFLPNHTDPVNRGFQMLMTQLQKKSGYSLSFQASDVGLMLLACREIISLIHWIGKVFRYANTGIKLNSAAPAELLSALGIDPDDMRNRYAEYRGRFLTLLPLLDVLPTPEIPLMYRAAQLAGVTLIDDKYADEQYQYKSTRYHFRPLGFNLITPISSTSTSKLEFFETQNFATMHEYLDLLELSINRILSRDDFKEISGRLTDHFAKTWSYRDIDIDSIQPAIYDAFTLNQLHNASVYYIGTSADSQDFKLHFDVETNEQGLIYSNPSAHIITNHYISMEEEPYTATKDVFIFNQGVDLNSTVPVTTDAVIDATRLKVGIKIPTGAKIESSLELGMGDDFYCVAGYLVCAWDMICNPHYLVRNTNGEWTATPEYFAYNRGNQVPGLFLPNYTMDAVNRPASLDWVVNKSVVAKPYPGLFITDNPMKLPMSAYKAMNNMASLSLMGVAGFFSN